MENKSKISAFIILAILLIGLAAALVVSSKKLISNSRENDRPIEVIKNEDLEKIEPVDMGVLENKYQEETNKIVDSYEELLIEIKNSGAADNNAEQELKNLKESLMAEVVPPKYKDLHLKLVLLFSDTEQLFSGDGLNIIQTARLDYNWLN